MASLQWLMCINNVSRPVLMKLKAVSGYNLPCRPDSISRDELKVNKGCKTVFRTKYPSHPVTWPLTLWFASEKRLSGFCAFICCTRSLFHLYSLTAPQQHQNTFAFAHEAMWIFLGALWNIAMNRRWQCTTGFETVYSRIRCLCKPNNRR